MQRLQGFLQRISLVLTLCLLVGCAGLGGTRTSTPVTSAPIPTLPPGPAGTPVPGSWMATAQGLGAFAFTVSPDSTAITQIMLRIPSLSCGGESLNGASFNDQGSWPVSNGQFTMDVPTLLFGLTLIGKFDPTGKQVVGIWEVTANSTLCPGTWTGNSTG